MNTINQLSSKIYNRISAGEVVERPSSVVKELVENSIDAHAKNIYISILNGGKTCIKVSDDGDGIDKSQLNKSILPHATSKISSLKDLDAIKTLGFRGEALSSIASVSKLKITSKTAEEDLGAFLYAEGGDKPVISDIGFSKGTEIEVNNLFFNTPAREKFLKTDRGEESEITSLVSRFILANPNVAFKYIADDELIYQSFGDGLESAFVAVYGTETLDECFRIESEKNGVTVKGYIGKHHFTKSTRGYQSIFLNGRYIINSTVASAITNAYGSYLMKRQYPFYVLSLDMPIETIDVNVHPNKMDVRFSNNGIVYSAVYSIVSKVLDGSSNALNIVVDNGENQLKKSSEINSDYVKHNVSGKTTFNNTVKFDKFVFADSKPELDFERKKQENNNVVDIFAENKAYIEKLEKEKNQKENAFSSDNVQEKIEIAKDLKYIGQVLNTYLIYEDGDDIYMVDQHAAHERIIFDSLMESFKKRKIDTQPLLLPYVLITNEQEHQFILSKMNIFKGLGIEIEEFGRTSFKVNAIPVVISSMNLDGFFKDVFYDLFALKSVSLDSVLYDKIASKACKSAIKSGDKLSLSEIEELTNKLKNNLGLKCPHGRPVCVRITRTEIDKWFKRIV